MEAWHFFFQIVNYRKSCSPNVKLDSSQILYLQAILAWYPVIDPHNIISRGGERQAAETSYFVNFLDLFRPIIRLGCFIFRKSLEVDIAYSVNKSHHAISNVLVRVQIEGRPGRGKDIAVTGAVNN